jgi:hypothetical protein
MRFFLKQFHGRRFCDEGRVEPVGELAMKYVEDLRAE